MVDDALGDALVVRQLEIHQTDQDVLAPSQWRLALGFKFVEAAPLAQLPDPEIAFGADLQRVRRRAPALFEGLRVGAPFPDVYDRALLRDRGFYAAHA